MLENIDYIQVALNLCYLEVKSQRAVIHVSNSCRKLLLNHVRLFSGEILLPAALHVRDTTVQLNSSSSSSKTMMTLWAMFRRISRGKKRNTIPWTNISEGSKCDNEYFPDYQTSVDERYASTVNCHYNN